MSKDIENKPQDNNNGGEKKVFVAAKSIFAELNAVSIVTASFIALLLIAAIGVYIFTVVPPPKKVMVIDDANVFTSEEETELEKAAETIKNDHDMNVIMITTRSKGSGYTNDDYGVSSYCKDMYDQYARKNKLRDNSGVIIILDLTLDSDGNRYFWIYQYGTAYLTLSDASCTKIANKAADNGLRTGDYAGAFEYTLESLGICSYNKAPVYLIYALTAIVPFIVCVFIYLNIGKVKIDVKPSVKEQVVLDQVILSDRKYRCRNVETGISIAGLTLRILYILLVGVLRGASSGGFSSSSGGGSSSRSSGGGGGHSGGGVRF